MAYKVFSNGDALTGGELNTYLMNQAVISFATATARDAALPSPSEGQLVWLEDSNKYVYYTGSAWSDLITSASSGNAIINGAFDIWQRGTSFSNPAYKAYLSDRWFASVDGTGVTRTISQQTFTPGTAPVSGYEGQFYMRFATTVAGTGMTANAIVQPIEDVRTFAGQTVTLSFWAKAGSAVSLPAPILGQEFGSGGSGPVYTAIGSSISITTSWARYTATVAVPAITGKTIGTSNYLSTIINFPVGSVSTIDIWGVQLEAASVATSFKRNANSLQGELAACQRYYFLADGTSSYFLAQGQCTSSSAGQVQCIFPVPMRTAPSLTVLGTLSTNFIVINSSGGSAGAPTSITLGAAATNKARVDFSGVSGLTAGHATTLQNGNSGTGLSWSAEL